MVIKGLHIAVLGAGRSGRAAARLALSHGARVSMWDTAGPEVFVDMPDGVEIHPHADENAGRVVVSDVLVVSPGIDTYGSLVTAFSQHASEVIGEIEFASRFFRGKVVGITGTNGKTTTTELVARILSHAGMDGTPCGNYGTPFAEVVMLPNSPTAVALELSSFQLETIRGFRPDVAVWLNFAPDHMDRYRSVDDYLAAKKRLFEYQTAADFAVIRSGEPLDGLAASSVRFSVEDVDAEWFFKDGKVIRGGHEWLDMEHQTSMRGLHNAENLMAAMAACEIMGVPQAIMCEALRGCAPPPHRCELVRTLDGVEYLNDSKATNLHALECALRSQTRPIVLICGGKEKGLDYSGVVPLLKQKALAAITFGQIARPLAVLFSQAVNTEAVPTITDAVTMARSLAPRGSTVLLSPGTSSFDQFQGYEHRGNAFRDLVHQLT